MIETGRLGLPLLDTVHQCQWRALLRMLPEQSVDLLLSDLPYNSTACDWDRYVVPLEAFWRHVKRVMKPRGAVVLTGSQPFTSKLVMSNEAWFRYEWVWHKSLATGYLNANRIPMKAHENILVFYDAAGTYNPQKTSGKPYAATSGSVGGTVRDKTVGGWLTLNTGERFPRTVLDFDSTLATVHPTQKPTALFEYLIRTYTDPGAVVVDPFAGSGTTAVAAANTGRHFICGDISQEYVDIARWRLSTEFGAQRPPKPDPPDEDLPMLALIAAAGAAAKDGAA